MQTKEQQLEHFSFKSFFYLSPTSQVLLFAVSLFFVAFGQPAWSDWAGFVAAAGGYALFWYILITHENPKFRFCLATAWFTAVQFIQLSWLLSHPYLYIVAVYFLVSLGIGIQFGILGLFIQRAQMYKIRRLIFIAALWTLMEWLRLFFLSGHSWNPIGLALTGNIYSLQMASLAGIYGLSFWVILVNLLGLKAWIWKKHWGFWLAWSIAALFPYLYGEVQLYVHERLISKRGDSNFNAVLVQTAFPIEESLPFWDSKQMISYVLDEWHQILKITKKHYGKAIDLLVLPEFVVPFGTYTYAYPYSIVSAFFQEVFGKEVLNLLPKLQYPLAVEKETSQGNVWMVNNAFWLQSLSNVFNTSVIAGLEDVEEDRQERRYYSSAQYFQCNRENNLPCVIQRYEKRVLVPMGEYIPFSFLKKLASAYGITGSFTPGIKAKVFSHPKIPFGVSICYEETFGELMRENRQLGAELLVNLTSDIWYPNSRLPQQHFDHARLRTVENGFPLIRACNTGITSGFDSLGKVIAVLGENHHEREWLADSLYVQMPTYTYRTLYSQVGDSLIISFCFAVVLLGVYFKDFDWKS